MIIFDTNVISELIRSTPSPTIIKNLRSFPSEDLYTTVLTEAEIRLGLAILPRGAKRTALQAQVDLILEEDFAGRILPFDSAAAQAYAQLIAARRTAGRPISVFDAQIAAIAQTRKAALVTRNIGDFEGCELVVINPWVEPRNPSQKSN